MHCFSCSRMLVSIPQLISLTVSDITLFIMIFAISPDYEPCTMLCLPVYSSDHSENEPAPVIGVAAVLDKIGGKT